MTAYFDHAATSPMRPESREEMLRLLGLVGNPSALHRAGQRARAALEEARERLAATLGCQPAEVIFTSGGSEADSIAILGGWAASGRPRALISAIEHPAVLGAHSHGAQLMPVTGEGTVDVDQAVAMIDAQVGIISCMLVNNETGIIQPVERLRGAAYRHGAWLHTDAVQALGHVPVDFRRLGVDLMSLSAHKVGGPVGVGALIARRDVQPRPIGLGGGQERNVRSGTGIVALASAFAVAAECALRDLTEDAVRLGAHQQRIATALSELGARVNSLEAPHAPHIVNATFPGLRAQDLLFLLDQRGIQASVGSACRAGVHQPSMVLQAMGRTEQEASETLRFSMGWSTTDAEVDELLDGVRRSVELAKLAL